MKYLLVFGNQYINEDNLALELADLLIKDRIKDLEIIKCVSPEEIFSYADKEFIILDVVQGLKEVKMITDIDQLKAQSIVSLHDFDLGFFLKLMKETNKLDRIKIIGIPQKARLDEIKKKVLSLIQSPTAGSV